VVKGGEEKEEGRRMGKKKKCKPKRQKKAMKKIIARGGKKMNVRASRISLGPHLGKKKQAPIGGQKNQDGKNDVDEDGKKIAGLNNMD